MSQKIIIRLLSKFALVGKMSCVCADILISFESIWVHMVEKFSKTDAKSCYFNNQMEFRKKSIIFGLLLLSMMPAYAISATSMEPQRILFLMQAGHQKEAIALYREYATHRGRHDSELLEQIGLALLDSGFRTHDPEIQLLTLFGAGIALNEKALYILLEGLKSREPELQLISMNLLSRFQHDGAEEAIQRAMSSNYLLIRLECLFLMSKKRSAKAFSQAEALMSKVNAELVALFPQMFAMIGSADAIRSLRKLLAHPKEEVRIQAILSTAKHGRDDLLPTIRTLASQHSSAQQEACAAALGIFKDEKSIAKLEAMAHSNYPTARLAALQALHLLGREEAREAIALAAKSEDLYAINILGEMCGYEDLLFSLSQHSNIQVRANASLALLRQHDPRCLKGICEILIGDSRDCAISKTVSQGQALTAYKVIPSARQNFKDDEVNLELSLRIREEALELAQSLPEKDFLLLAETLFLTRQDDLVPSLVDALEKLQTASAIDLLKKQQQRVGAPLIRNYCNLALYRLQVEGPYADNLKAWIGKQHKEAMIRFRPYVPTHTHTSLFQLTQEETSRLLVESYEALTNNQDAEGIDVLLKAIQEGHSINKYALAGLLMRAAE